MSMMTEFADGKFTDLMRKASPRQKLVMARQIAEGLEAVHNVGNKGYATLVHNDINMANIVVSKKGVPMLNDFNIGVLMMKNRKTQEQCGFVGRYPNPQVIHLMKKYSISVMKPMQIANYLFFVICYDQIQSGKHLKNK